MILEVGSLYKIKHFTNFFKKSYDTNKNNSLFTVESDSIVYIIEVKQKSIVFKQFFECFVLVGKRFGYWYCPPSDVIDNLWIKIG